MDERDRSRNVLSQEEYDSFIAELMEELNGSQRAAILIAAAMLDEFLRRLLFVVMLPNTAARDLLADSASAPLGNFSARIKAACALGLISESETKGIDIIRKIRNDYAHKQRKQLNDDRIMRLTQALTDLVQGPRLINRDIFADAAPLTADLVKVRVVGATLVYLGLLHNRFADAELRRVTVVEA